MKATIAVSLDDDVAEFLARMLKQSTGNTDDPSDFINNTIRAHRDQRGVPRQRAEGLEEIDIMELWQEHNIAAAD